MATTQLIPGGYSGRPYGSFAGKVAAVVVVAQVLVSGTYVPTTEVRGTAVASTAVSGTAVAETAVSGDIDGY